MNNKIKEYAHKIWDTYDDTFWYASEKKRRVEMLDEEWQVVQMFDYKNKLKMLRMAMYDNNKWAFKIIWELMPNFYRIDDEDLEEDLKTFF